LRNQEEMVAMVAQPSGLWTVDFHFAVDPFPCSLP